MAVTAAIPGQCDGSWAIYSYNPEDIEELRGCTAITGHLQLSAGELVDISALSELTSIGDYFKITAAGFSDLTELAVLTDIAGLDGVESVDGELTLSFSPLLCQSVVDAFLSHVVVESTVTTIFNDESC